MYSTQFLPLIIAHYRRCKKIFKYYPFQFNPVLKRFVHVNTPHGDKMFKLLLLILLSYTVCISCHLYLTPIPGGRKFQGVVFCIMYFIIVGSSRTYLDKSQIQMMNTCQDFETKILEGYSLIFFIFMWSSSI